MSIKHIKMKYSLIIISLCIILFGCNKEKPPIGRYLATFNYENPQGLVKLGYLDITESTKNTLTINGSIVQKDGKSITGSFLVYSTGYFYIDGTWSKKLFSNNYKIKGSFTQTYHEGGQSFTNYGSFTIESD